MLQGFQRNHSNEIPPRLRANGSIVQYGNTTAATIPLCLWDFKHEINKGDLIVLAAFSGGFT
ncbi:MAG TPA: 3-oxoacyl-[acyl-carrier-protein] synthase III C-terminal domain-containing protein [Chitinophagaceae bacterium]